MHVQIDNPDTNPVGKRLPSVLTSSWKMAIAATGLMTVLLLIAQISGSQSKPQVPDGPQEAKSEPERMPANVKLFGTSILPGKEPFIATGQFDEKGNPIRIACATCHATKPANPSAVLGQPLKQFHQEIAGSHGQLTCTSCHNASEGYGSLRLADGRSVPYTESMTLCAQCHGTQFRDYQHGAHGGMTGHWDLTKGGRTRNTCTTCHNPHSPKYPIVVPAPPPHVRQPPRGNHE